MAEREFRTTPQWPIATTPLSGDELVEVWKGGKQYYVPFSELGGMPAAHSGTHKHGGDDEVGTLDNLAYGIPKLDADGLIDSRVSDASTTTKGKVQLATDGEEDGTKAVTGTDSRLSDARDPTAHASEHVAGSDVIPDATVTVPGLMSAADKVKADATIPAYIPTEDQKAALVGTSGTPSENNRYITEASIGVDVAPLEDGVVPSTYLPSYVDDVLEFANQASFPATGEASKIYVAIDTNLTFRWSGSEYVEISKSLALGETSATAYRGDRGKTAYDHSQSAHAPADADNTQTAINSASEKTTPVDGDAFSVLDSAASNALKKTTLANVKAVLKGYFDSFYSGGGGGGGGTTGLDLIGIGRIGNGVSISIKTSQSLAYLSATEVALVNGSNNLAKYSFDGSDWSLVGNVLSISGFSSHSCIGPLTSTDIVLYNETSKELATYRFDGTNWAKHGNGFSHSLSTSPTIAKLSSSEIAIRDGGRLAKYSFDGSDWSLVGNVLGLVSLGMNGNGGVSALTSTDVAMVSEPYEKLGSFRFDGTNWSKIGVFLDMPGIDKTSIASINSTDIALIDDGLEQLSIYRFNGSVWAKGGNSLTISGTKWPSIAMLTESTVALVSSYNDELQTYNFLFGYDSASVNIVADYEVPEIATGKSIVIRRTSAYNGNPVTITPPSGATFEGLSEYLLYEQYSSVTLERISSTVFVIQDEKINKLSEVGEIKPFASTVPKGFKSCDGSALSRATFPVLFAAIGTTFGAGDGSTTFNLPDLREAVLVGTGTRGAGVAAHDTYTLGQFKDDEVQGHNHNFYNSYGTPTEGAAFTTRVASGNSNFSVLAGDDQTGAVNSISLTGAISDTINGVPRIGTTTHGKQMGVNYAIRYA